MEREPDEQFRALFWKSLVPLLGLPVFALLLLRAPITHGWSITTWITGATLVAVAIAMYLLRSWQKAKVVLADGGIRMYIDGRLVTWPYEDLLKVKQVGRYRVRMCMDVGQNDGQHTHISIDLSDSDAFTDALLDRYALTQGHELEDGSEPEALAA
jgi:hypothetical protein